MHKFACGWNRRNYCLLVLAGVAALSMGGCPPQTPDDNGNDNEPPPGHQVTVVITPTGSGSVQQDADGQMVTLTAVAAEGFVFVGWTGADVDDPSATTITVDATVVTTITANFEEEGEPSPGDSDGDGVRDTVDECPDTEPGALVDDVGCPLPPSDGDNDGVVDEDDACPNTTAGATVDDNGCSPEQLDDDSDGVSDAVDECPDTVPRTAVDTTGCPVTGGGGGGPPPPGAVCGNGNLETGEQCDDGNTAPGDGCSPTCQNEPTNNDLCASPASVGDGTRAFSNVGANTDGPDEPTMCNFFGRTQVNSDIWYCYTASCTGTAFFSLCGSNYDTKLAVYNGCGCPTVPPLACSDDDCGRGVENVQSRVTVSVTAGQQYMVRVGGFLNETGDGRLTIGCNTEDCPAGSGDCFTAHTGNGCSDATCCGATCDLDQFCCDVEWDATCAGEAQGICTGSFASCAPRTGLCSVPDSTPGCEDVDCCNTVCRNDPYCCLQEWDATCVNEAESACFLTCGRTTDSCLTQHVSPGCSDDSCCRLVCAEDPFCCDTGWDNVCADLAAQVCP